MYLAYDPKLAIFCHTKYKEKESRNLLRIFVHNAPGIFKNEEMAAILKVRF